MKTKNFTLIYLLLFMSFRAMAQTYVYIPDANFRAWLTSNNYTACMNSDSLDITCSIITSPNSVDVSNLNIADLTGIEYFTGLQALNCSFNQLTSLPALPNRLTHLYCHNNQLTNLPAAQTHLNYFAAYFQEIPLFAGFIPKK